MQDWDVIQQYNQTDFKCSSLGAQVDYRPTTDAEWRYLQRRFAALERRSGMRELFDNSLDGSPYDPSMRRQFRREIFENVREMASPRAAYQNPYFELSWYRAVQINPALDEDYMHNRAVLWQAYYNRPEPDSLRRSRQREWDHLVGVKPAEAGLETITDGEEREDLAVE
jgi:hypothetical protein